MYVTMVTFVCYHGNLAGLTFSVDEQEFGKVVTEELMPGGTFTPVTSTNRISYIHQVEST